MEPCRGTCPARVALSSWTATPTISCRLSGEPVVLCNPPCHFWPWSGRRTKEAGQNAAEPKLERGEKAESGAVQCKRTRFENRDQPGVSISSMPSCIEGREGSGLGMAASPSSGGETRHKRKEDAQKENLACSVSLDACSLRRCTARKLAPGVMGVKQYWVRCCRKLPGVSMRFACFEPHWCTKQPAGAIKLLD